jgi:hypothetical protein
VVREAWKETDEATEMRIESPKTEQKKSGGARRLTTLEVDAVWDEIQALRANGLGWKPPKSGINNESFHPPVVPNVLDRVRG